MNQRMEELAKQAGLEWVFERAQVNGKSSVLDSLELFSQLIVLECSEVAKMGAKPEFQLAGDYARGSEHAAWRIENHFGVEK